MNFFSKHKVIIWILTGSLIITLSILASLIYHTWAVPEKIVTQQACTTSCLMLFNELDLDATQEEELEIILDHFSDSSASLISDLRQLRLALMEELQKDKPDSLRIFLLSEELGASHARMTNQAVYQYLQIRAICNPDQLQRLTNVYCDLFGCSRINMGKEQGQKQHRHRNGGE
jgi:Spy/CpxP family protein refolding chaperone